MKKHLIFKIFAILAIALYQLPTMAQGIIIYHKDGTQTKYSYESIDSIVTYIKDEAVDDEDAPVETGFLYIAIKPQLGYDNGTRAVVPSFYENMDNYTVEIFKDTTLVGTYPASKLFNIQPLELPQGQYTVKASCGAEHPASRDEILFYGESTCVVSAGNKTHVTITCKTTSTRITVDFKDSFKSFFYDYTISIEGLEALEGKTITWSENDAEPWYVKVKDGGESVKCTVVAKLKEEYVEDPAYEQKEYHTFTMELKPGKAYRIAFGASAGNPPSIYIEMSSDTSADTDVEMM